MTALPEERRTKGSTVVALLVAAYMLGACASQNSALETGPPLRVVPEAVGMSSERLGRLDQVLESFVEEGRIPGYQLLVARGGHVVHESVHGSLDLESRRALRPDTIYRIYSMSKVITGVATMIAYERGSFLLNLSLIHI